MKGERLPESLSLFTFFSRSSTSPIGSSIPVFARRLNPFSPFFFALASSLSCFPLAMTTRRMSLAEAASRFLQALSRALWRLFNSWSYKFWTIKHCMWSKERTVVSLYIQIFWMPPGTKLAHKRSSFSSHISSGIVVIRTVRA